MADMDLAINEIIKVINSGKIRSIADTNEVKLDNDAAIKLIDYIQPLAKERLTAAAAAAAAAAAPAAAAPPAAPAAAAPPAAPEAPEAPNNVKQLEDSFEELKKQLETTGQYLLFEKKNENWTWQSENKKDLVNNTKTRLKKASEFSDQFLHNPMSLFEGKEEDTSFEEKDLNDNPIARSFFPARTKHYIKLLSSKNAKHLNSINDAIEKLQYNESLEKRAVASIALAIKQLPPDPEIQKDLFVNLVNGLLKSYDVNIQLVEKEKEVPLKKKLAVKSAWEKVQDEISKSDKSKLSDAIKTAITITQNTFLEKYLVEINEIESSSEDNDNLKGAVDKLINAINKDISTTSGGAKTTFINKTDVKRYIASENKQNPFNILTLNEILLALIDSSPQHDDAQKRNLIQLQGRVSKIIESYEKANRTDTQLVLLDLLAQKKGEDALLKEILSDRPVNANSLQLALLNLLQADETTKKLGLLTPTMQLALINALNGSIEKTKLLKFEDEMKQASDKHMTLTILSLLQGYTNDANVKTKIQKIQETFDGDTANAIKLALVALLGNETTATEVNELRAIIEQVKSAQEGTSAMTVQSLLLALLSNINSNEANQIQIDLQNKMTEMVSEIKTLLSPKTDGTMGGGGVVDELNNLQKDARGVADTLETLMNRFEAFTKNIDSTAIEEYNLFTGATPAPEAAAAPGAAAAAAAQAAAAAAPEAAAAAAAAAAPGAPGAPAAALGAPPAAATPAQGAAAAAAPAATARTELVNSKDKSELEKKLRYRIIGSDEFLSSNGKAFLEQVDKTIQEKKAALENIRTKITEMYASVSDEPTLKRAKDILNKALDGDFTETSSSPGILKRMDDVREYMTNILTEDMARLKPISLAFKSMKANKDSKKKKDKDPKDLLKTLLNRDKRGGAGTHSEETAQQINKLRGLVNDIKRDINDKVIQETIVKFSEVLKRREGITGNASDTGPVSPTIFSRLFNRYLEERDENATGDDLKAAISMSEALEANNMIPREVLRVTTLDKVVFIFVTLFIRLVALTIAEALIERGHITRMPLALGAFLGFYIALFIVFVLLVNFDMYRMRIVFNYVNFHINKSYVLSHVILLLMFSGLIFLIMWNINFPIEGIQSNAISEDEKVELIYRLEVLTMIVWMFMVITIAVM